MPTATLVEGVSQMAATRQSPWLTLGHKVEESMGIDEALKVSGSDDDVYPVGLFDLENASSQVDHVDPNYTGTFPGAEEVEGVTGIKSSKYGIMGVMGNGYAIKQRRDIVELAYDITGLSQDGAHIDIIGNVGAKAEKFFAYIKVPDLVIDPNGIADTIERGLYVATSYNGSLPNIIGYGNTRLSCLNQLHMTLKGLTQAIKVRHTRNAEERMQQAAVALQYVGAVEKEVVAKAEAMLKVDGDKALDKLLDNFWPLEKDAGDLTKTRRARERGEIRIMYEGADNTNVRLAGRTGWAAYNAVVEYLDHGQGVKGVKGTMALKRKAERAVLPGTTADKKLKASSLVLSMN